MRFFGVIVLSFLEEVLWLSVEVCPGLLLCAPVAPDSSCEVVVLALAADPASVREGEVLLVACHSIDPVSLVELGHSLLLGRAATFLFLLIFCPF